MPEKLSAAATVRKLVDDNLPLWQLYWDAMDEEESFLDGDRYENTTAYNRIYNRDRRLTQIRGQETMDTIRHVVAQATAKPRSVEARPRDRESDPEMAEIAASLVEWELSDPWKGFEDEYEATIQSCREKRLGALWMDYVPEFGPFGGEMVYRNVDPRRIMWDATWNPHHILCEWFWEAKRVPIEWVHDNFPGSEKWVMPDRESFRAGRTRTREGFPFYGGLVDQWMRQNLKSDDRVTLWCTWYKNDRSVDQRKRRERPERFQPFKSPDQRYMFCAECGFRSPTQGELGQILPDSVGPCPECQIGPLERIEGTTPVEEIRAYTNGRRLVMTVPGSPAPDDQSLYDGKWPIPEARSFPALVLTSYIKPGRPMGPSDPFLMWDQQIASDNLRTIAVQRVFEHRNYWVLPRNGMFDAQGRRFTFRDDQYNIMYRDASVMGPLDVQQISGSGLDPAWGVAFNSVQAALTQYRGVTDLGITPESSKIIAASTVAQLNQMGEIPTAHFNRRKNRALSKFYGVVWDYIRATYTPQRLARLRIEGLDHVLRLSGDDLPNFDFVIEDTPDFTGMEKARSEAFRALADVARDAPDMVGIFAEINNLPRSVLRKIERVMEQRRMLQEQQMMAAAAAGGGLPGPEGEEAGLPSVAPEGELVAPGVGEPIGLGPQGTGA